MRESDFQRALKKELEIMFPGCIVMKTDPGQIQGIPDLLILYRDRWAMLECKRATNSTKQNNQSYYVDMFDDMSFCRFIRPENKEEVLHELQFAFRT